MPFKFPGACVSWPGFITVYFTTVMETTEKILLNVVFLILGLNFQHKLSKSLIFTENFIKYIYDKITYLKNIDTQIPTLS